MSVPLLILLHGLGQTPQTWMDQVTAMPPATKAVAPWLEGCRPGALKAFSMTAAADAALAQLNRFGVDQAAIMGTGLGALVALEAAIRSPGAVSHLVLEGAVSHTPRFAGSLQRATARAVPPPPNSGLDRERLISLVDAITRFDARDRLCSVTASTLLLHGAEDQAGASAAEAVAAGLAQARIVAVAGAGSQPHLEAAEEFNQVAYDFLT